MAKRIRTLEKARNKELERAVNQLLENSFSDAEDSLRRLEAYTTLLETMKARHALSRGWVLVAIAVFFCVTLAVCLWSLRVPRTEINLEVRTKAVELELVEPWEWSGRLPVDLQVGLYIRGISNIKAQTLYPPIDIDLNTRDAWIHCEVGDYKSNVWLTKMEVDEESMLIVDLSAAPSTDLIIKKEPRYSETMDVEDSVLIVEQSNTRFSDLHLKNARFYGTMDVAGLLNIKTGNGETSIQHAVSMVSVEDTLDDKKNHGESVEFWAVKDVDPYLPSKISFQLHSGKPWALCGWDRPIKVRKMSLSKLVPSGLSREISPAITEGRLSILGTSEVVTLREKERLSLDGVDGQIHELQLGEEINLVFSGTVRSIALGPEDTERNLKPTLLEYLYHHKKLGYLWAAVVFLWGLMWGARKFLPL